MSRESQPHIWIPFRWWRSPANVTVPLLGKDSFQEIDIAGITMPITKHNFIVKDVKELADDDTQSIPHRTDRKTGTSA